MDSCANTRTTLDGTLEEIGGLMHEVRAKVSRMDAFLFLNGEKPTVACGTVNSSPSAPPCAMDKLRMILEIASGLASRLDEINNQLGA